MLDKIMHTTISSLIAICALFILTRIIGKKQMSQLTFFDYVIGISIGSIAARYAVVRTMHIAEVITALVIFTMFSIVSSFTSRKSYIGRKLLDGTPTILIENGRIIEEGLKKSRLNINDLLEECRQRDVFDITEIEFAILETSGRLSVLLKSQNHPLTPKDMSISTDYKGLCANVIIDGKIIKEHLHTLNLDENWLHSELHKQNINSSSDILLAYVDSSGVFVFHPKDMKLSETNNFIA